MSRSFHPMAWWLWAASLAISVARFSSILLSCVVVFLLALVVSLKSEDAPWARSFQYALKMGLFVIFIRMFFGVVIGTPSVGTTLFSLPAVPLPTWMTGIRIGGAVTSERLISTAHEGILLASILAILAAASSLTSPHRLLRSLPVVIYEFGVAVVIATSVFPQIAASSKRIREAQLLRGHELRRLRDWRRFALPLLEDSLSRSLDLAASMDARGYGVSRKRSRYRSTKWQPREYLLVLVALIAITSPVVAIASALLPLFIAPDLKAVVVS